jgi:hypothetical protein
MVVYSVIIDAEIEDGGIWCSYLHESKLHLAAIHKGKESDAVVVRSMNFCMAKSPG